jgi:hypothetical protein
VTFHLVSEAEKQDIKGKNTQTQTKINNRVSSHHLQIELGRYQGIPRHQRLCQQCSSGEVEDEIHFLFKCSKYEPDRKISLPDVDFMLGKKVHLNFILCIEGILSM